MIEADNVSFTHAGRQIIPELALTLAPGSVTVVIGPNGAGKSTLLKLICGELRPTSGHVTYHGQDIAGMAAPALARRRAVLPQSTELSFPFTALEVVRMGAVAYGSRQASADALSALARVGLAGFGPRPYHRLSGGEQQRVQFARALAQLPQAVEENEPRALFLDEPTASLDLSHQIAVLETARQFARAGGIVMAVLHDLNLAAEFADRLVVMREGRIVAAGAPQETLSEALVADVYGINGAVGRLPPEAIPFVLSQARLSAG